MSVYSCSKQLKRVAKEGFKIKLPSPGRRVVSASQYVMCTMVYPSVLAI